VSAWNWTQITLFFGSIFMWSFGDRDTAWFMFAISALMEVAEINETIRAQAQQEGGE
jgi:hypothetical protein